MGGAAGVAVVTGGSRGIGSATSVALAEQGWDVCLGYREAHDAADAIARRCADLGVAARAVRTDVCSADDVGALFDAAAEMGAVRGLVNNAGIVDRAARVDEMGPRRLERMFAVNVVGAFLVAGEAVRRMSTRHGGGGGVIVNVSSAAARLGSPGEYVDYSASKAAIDTLTVGLAKEVGREGIRVNAVRPGLIRTDIHASGGRPDRVEQLADGVPLGRGGEAREVAEAIAWLCSEAASYVTAAILDVSGGR
jgi:NAD(P)-dependent dehydrogenase (short-subunit alcohol dehydrogenase family)